MTRTPTLLRETPRMTTPEESTEEQDPRFDADHPPIADWRRRLRALLNGKSDEIAAHRENRIAAARRQMACGADFAKEAENSDAPVSGLLAIRAYQRALSHLCPEETPQEWALTQWTLARRLYEFGWRYGHTAYRDQAIEACWRLSPLAAGPRERIPFHAVHRLLGDAAHERAHLAESPTYFLLAAEAYATALGLLPADAEPSARGLLEHNLASCRAECVTHGLLEAEAR